MMTICYLWSFLFLFFSCVLVFGVRKYHKLSFVVFSIAVGNVINLMCLIDLKRSVLLSIGFYLTIISVCFMILAISINFNKIKGLGFLGYLLIGEIFLLYLLKTFEFSDPLNELLFSFELITFTFLNFFPGGSSGVWFFIILSTSLFYFVIDPLLKKFIYKILLLILYLFLFFLPFFFIVAFIF